MYYLNNFISEFNTNIQFNPLYVYISGQSTLKLSLYKIILHWQRTYNYVYIKIVINIHGINIQHNVNRLTIHLTYQYTVPVPYQVHILSSISSNKVTVCSLVCTINQMLCTKEINLKVNYSRSCHFEFMYTDLCKLTEATKY